MSRIVEKRYRFHLDLDDPAHEQLDSFLTLLDNMKGKERSAFLTKALATYHHALIHGLVPASTQNDQTYALMAQTLSMRNEYTAPWPLVESLGESGHTFTPPTMPHPATPPTQQTSANTAPASTPPDNAHTNTSIPESVESAPMDSRLKQKIGSLM